MTAATLVHDFYLPMPEAQIRTGFTALNTGTTISTTLDSVFSIVVTGTGTVVYYDHWEDGYETDLANPVQSTTQVWGDGNDANGIPPGYAHDPSSFPAGTVLTLRNNVTLPRNPSTILYDARDRVAATKALVVSRAAWALTPGPVLAGAVEVTATIDYGTSYECPVGEDIGVHRFDYVGLMIMAEQDGTSVTIDTDGSGAASSFIVTLNRGESYQVNGGIKKGATVTSTKRVEVQVMTGRKSARYGTSWFTLYPTDQWSSSYVTPVGTASNGSAAMVYLYNPGASSITVNYQTRVSSGSLSVAAGGVTEFQMPKSSGASFTSSGGENFFALCNVGASPSSDVTYDWGFSLTPASGLTSQAVVGWGPGSSDLSVNGSPVWLTATNAVRVYVDYNGDHSGSLTDPNGDQYDVHYDLTALQSQTIYDPDKDQTAMRLYTVNGASIAVAWGQDPSVAGAGNPYLDLGTTVLPFPVPVIHKSVVIYTDNGDSGLSVGDVLEYTIQVDNKGLLPLGNLVTLDSPPATLSYVAGTTTLDGVAIADDATGSTIFPLDESGYVIPLILRAGTSTFKYRATIVAPGLINNTASTDGNSITAETTVYAQPPAGATAASVDFTTAAGAVVSTYQIGDLVYVTLTDGDANTNTTTLQTISIVVKNTVNNDLETITLTETGVNTGVFRNTTGLPTSTTAGLLQEDGTLNVAAANSISVNYVDPLFFDTDSATVTIQTPSLTKQLYLTDTLALDRVDPVATSDATTAHTGTIGTSGISVANITTNAANSSSLTISHDPGSGTDRLMLVSVVTAATSTTGSNAGAVTGVTFGGTPLTLVTATNDLGAANPRVRCYLYRLINPSSGAANVVVSMSSSTPLAASVITFDGVDQTTPLGTPLKYAEGGSGATGPTSAGITNIVSATGETVFDLICLDQDGGNTNALVGGTGQTILWSATNLVSGSSVGLGAVSIKNGAALVTNRWTWTGGEQDQYGIIGVSIKPSSGGASSTATFTQSPAFSDDFSMPAGGALSVQVAATVTSGSMPANPAITAYLKYGATTFATLSSPTYSSGTLSWSGTLGSNVTIPSGSAVSLVVSNAQTGVAYTLDYDSTTAPSKISLPTTTVIKVTSVGIYDAPYSGGSSVASGANGSTFYLRTAVTDPFGSSDITSLDYSIDGPGTTDDLSGTLTAGNVVSDDGFTKTYEYVWNTGGTEGNYSASVTAHEGYEGTVTDSSSVAMSLNFLDLGTPSSVAFTSTDNGTVVTTFAGNATVWLRVSDQDKNTNSTSAQSITATVTSSSGDSELVTLTETGVNTGIFTASLTTSTSSGSGANNGTLYAPLGSVITLTYSDPDDASDTTTTSAVIPAASPSISVTHTRLAPTDSIATVGETVQFQVSVVNNGNTTLNSIVFTDTFTPANLTFSSATTTPDSTTPAGTLTWNNIGPLASGASTNIIVTYTAAGSAAPATVTAAVNADSGTATASANATVTITHPELTITQTELSPGTGNANIGDTVTFRIVLDNTGDTVISSLPFEEIYSSAYYQYSSATVAPDATGGGSILWSNLGPLGVGSSITIDVTFTVVGGSPSPGGVAASASGYGDYATDTNGDSVSVVSTSSSASITLFAAKISGTVYNDADSSGTFTAGDSGLQDVTVSLYTDPNADGDPSDGTLVKISVTDASGNYDFLNLSLTNYVIQVTEPFGMDPVSPVNNRLSQVASAYSDYSGKNFFYATDTTAPAAPSVPDMTAGTDTGGSNTDNITSNNTPTFTGTAEPGSTVKLYSDYPSPGTLIGTGVADSSGNYSITVSTLADGTHHITATATDEVGNVSVASGALTVLVDTTSPAAVITGISGDTGSSSSDYITKDNTLVFSGTTSAGAAVTLTLTNSAGGTVFTTTVTADASGNWTYDYTGTPLGDGDYTLIADSGTTATQAITVDTTNPAGPVTSTPQTTDNTTPTITGTAIVGAGETFTVTVNGVTYTVGDGNLTIDGSGNWSLTIPAGNALPPANGNAGGFDGNYTVTATITDTAGNTLTATSNLKVTVFSVLTPATGGGAISADNFGTGTYVTLTGPVYAEGVSGDVGLGTIILKAPTGFEFDTGGVAPTVLVTGNATNATYNINGATTGSSLAVSSVSASQITFTVSSESFTTNTLTWQNLRVRPTAGTPLATGNLTMDSSSTGTLTDVTAGTTNLGALAEVAGAFSAYKLTAAASSVTVGNTDQLTITQVDQYGNPVTSFSGDLGLTFSGLATSPSGSVPTVTDKSGSAVNEGTSTTITFVNGVSTVGGLLTMYAAEGPVTLNVTDGTKSTSTTGGSGVSLTATAGTGSAYRITAASGTPTAGATDVLTIKQVDQYGNTVTSVNGDVALTFSGLSTSGGGNVPTVTDKSGSAINEGTATTITFTSGVATAGGSLVAYAAETATLDVTDGSLSSTGPGGTGATLTVSAGAASAYRITAASGTPTAGAADVLTIKQVDAYGNTITGLTGDVALTFSGLGTAPGGSVPTVTDKTGSAVDEGTVTTVTFTSGVATAGGSLVAYKAETATLNVTDGTHASTDAGGAGAALTVGAGAQSAYRIVAASGTPTAGSTDALTIAAVDQYGNTVTGLTGDVVLTFSGLATSGGGNVPTVTDKSGSAVNEGTATTVTFTSGVSTAGGSLVPYAAETATLNATDGTYSTTTTGGTGAALTVSGGAATRLGFTTQPDKAEINAAFLQQPVVQTQDAYGNPSTVGLGASVSVTVTLTAGSGALSGTATLDIGTGAGNGTVTYTDLQVDTAGSGHQLTAAASGFTSGVSSLFDVWTVLTVTGDRVIADRGPYYSTGTILISRLANPASLVLITSIKDPYEIAREADGNYVVVDYETSRGGGLFRIDKLTLNVSTVAVGGTFVVPFGVKVESKGTNADQILVADLDAYAQKGAVFRVDPVTGAQTTLTASNNFYFLQGLAVAPTNTPNFGDIYVTSVGDGASITSKLIKIDPDTGAQTVISDGQNFNYPVGMAVESDGQILVVDAKAQMVIRVDPTQPSTANQTILSDNSGSHGTGTAFILPTHVSLDGSGELFLTDAKVNAGTNERTLFKIDRTTGNRTLITQDGFFEQPRGVLTVP